jgi:hypothetical protein
MSANERSGRSPKKALLVLFLSATSLILPGTASEALAATPSTHAAAMSETTATTLTQLAPLTHRSWLRGYRNGFRQGRRDARADCNGDEYRYRVSVAGDYEQGYAQGYRDAFLAYCPDL